VSACQPPTEAEREHCGQGASCMTTTAAAPSTAPSQRIISPTVSVNGLRFTLPPELTYRRDGATSTGEFVEGFYANFVLSSSCANGCGSSFGHLPPNGVVIGLGMLSGFPPQPTDAPNTSVAGRRASYAISEPGICGDDETITVRIPHPDLGEYVVRACLSGPDLAAGERIVQAVVGSATFTTP
jgi:hypothetical protein